MDNTRPYGRITPGLTLAGIGCVHQIVGLLLGFGLVEEPGRGRHTPLFDIFASGFFNAIGAQAERMISFWFLLFGFMMILAGVFLHRIESTGGALSRDLAVGLGLICMIGVLLIPQSGFWLGFVPCWQIWRRTSGTASRRTHRAP
jgi:Family of unknown function (DUF6463)